MPTEQQAGQRATKGPGSAPQSVARPAPAVATQRGSRDAFSEAFDHLFALARGAARNRGLSQEDAHDVAQETMARCYAAWSKVGHQPYLEAWVMRVANYVAVDHVRKHARMRVGSEINKSAPSLDRTDSMVLEHALAKLPRRQREVVVLRYLNDLPEEQVAAALGCSVGAVRSSCDRGKRKLAEVLGDHEFAAFRAPAEAVGPDAGDLVEAVQHGTHIRAARRFTRAAGVAVVVVLVAIGAWVFGRPDAKTRQADTTTTSVVTTTLSTTTSTVPTPTTVPVAPAVPSTPVPVAGDIAGARAAIEEPQRNGAIVSYGLAVTAPSGAAFEPGPDDYCAVHAYFGDVRADYQEKRCSEVLPARVEAGQTVTVPGLGFV